MSTWYRAHRSDDIQTVFSGDGGLFTSGRWNHLGRKVTYCADSIALCTLEWLANHGLSVSGFSYYRYAITIPDNLILTVSVSDLPKDWDFVPVTDCSRDFAETHLFSTKKYVAMCVPSVIVPEENNLIINPYHAKFIDLYKNIRELGKYTAPARVNLSP